MSKKVWMGVVGTVFCAAALSQSAMGAERRPLMETYMGQWCPWSPRAIVANGRMKAKYGAQYVNLIYHLQGKYSTKAGLFTVYPYPVGGSSSSPDMRIDRRYQVDPYYGSSYTGSHTDMYIEEDWLKVSAQSASTVDVSVQTALADTNTLAAKVTLGFEQNATGSNYRVALVLLGDSIPCSQWAEQYEYYYGQRNGYQNDASCKGADWEVFTKGNSTVINIAYNDVVLRYETPLNGQSGLLPADIRAGEKMIIDRNIDISAITNRYGNPIVFSAHKLKVAAIVFRTSDGAVENCALSGYPQEGMSGVTALEAEPVSICFTDLYGNPVDATAFHGFFIETTIRANGKRTSVKRYRP